MRRSEDRARERGKNIRVTAAAAPLSFFPLKSYLFRPVAGSYECCRVWKRDES